jgi:hypothetical protein
VADLGLPLDHLLPEALLRRHERKLGLAFRLLEIRYPARTIQLVYTNLDSEDRAVRANALEVADNVLSKEEARLILPLLEDLPLEDKLKAGEERFSLERRPPEEWLLRLLEDPEPWIVACALHLVRERRLEDVDDLVSKAMLARDAVVRETACFTLMTLIERETPVRSPEFTRRAETLRRLAHRASADATPEVRRAGDALLTLLVPLA